MLRYKIKILLLFLFLVFIQNIKAQETNLRFKHIQITDGLSHNRVYDIFQDKNGYIWIATEDGLNKYDGFRIIRYKNNKFDSSSLAGNVIRHINEDLYGNLWIATNTGLSRYDRTFDKFQNYYYSPQKKQNTLTNEYVWATQMDPLDSSLWIGLMNGLNKLNLKTNTITDQSKLIEKNNCFAIHVDKFNRSLFGCGRVFFVYENNKTKKYKHPKNNDILNFSEDNQQNIWIATRHGYFKFLVEKDTAIYFPIDYNAQKPYRLAHSNILDILYTNGLLYMGTRGGLNIHDLNTKQNQIVKNDFYDKYSLSNNIVNTVFKDNSGIIWLGTDKGVNIYNKQFQVFKHIKQESYKENTLKHKGVNAIAETENYIWIVNNSKLLNRYNKQTKQFEIIEHPDKVIYTTIDNEEKLLFLTSNELLYWDKEKDKIKTIKNFGKRRFKLLQTDSKNNYYILNTDGILKYNQVFDSLTIYEKANKKYKEIFKIATEGMDVDRQGNIWFGSRGNGLFRINPNGKVEHYLPEENNVNSISSIMINSIHVDKKNNVWIGTKTDGLCLYNPEKNNFINYRERDGLISNYILSVITDDKGVLWITTSRGLTRYNPKTKEAKSFTVKDGLLSGTFNYYAAYKNNDGFIYFGSRSEGYNVFHPDSIKDNPYPPIVDITDFHIFNQPVIPSENSVLKKHISETDSIYLTYRENILTFYFTSLHYANPEKNKFAYKLENFDSDWIYTSSKKHFASYSNIPAGVYYFKVKASNNNGVWNKQPKTIKIVISPPFWERWWFRISLTIFIIALVYTVYTLRINAVKKQKAVLEEKNAILVEQQEEILQQNEEISSQAEQLSFTHKELKKLSIVASETDCAIVITDPEGNYEWTNESFKRIFGYDIVHLKNQKTKKNIRDEVLDEENSRKIERVFSEKLPVVYEAELQTHGEKKVWVQSSITPITDEQNDLTKLVVVYTDISKQKQAEKEILEQTRRITSQNMAITSSIGYAQNIQEAILPVQKKLEEYYETFIIYRPKDIVSGDFYWYYQYPDKNVSFIAVIDCTGHGVPGAFMSMIGYSLLNEIVREKQISSPQVILEKLDTGIKNALKQEQTENNDGMDVAFARVEKNETNNYKITYCGAKRPLFIYDAQNNEIKQLKGCRRSIGGAKKKRKHVEFKNEELILKKNDVIYLSSDGLVDQNSETRQKFGTPKFVTILEEVAGLSLQIQKETIEEALDQHMGQALQRDDISIIGIKF